MFSSGSPNREGFEILISFVLVIAALFLGLWFVQHDAPEATVTVDHQTNGVTVNWHPTPATCPAGMVCVTQATPAHPLAPACPPGYVCTPK